MVESEIQVADFCQVAWRHHSITKGAPISVINLMNVELTDALKYAKKYVNCFSQT